MDQVEEGHKEATIDQVKEEEDTKATIEKIGIPNDQEETYMKNDTTKIFYQLGSSTFIKAGFLAEEKVSSINFHIEDYGLASCFQNNQYPIANRICQRMQYQGKRLGIHEQGIREPIQFHDNPRHQGLGYSSIRKSNDVSDISMTLGDALFDTNIKMESMSSPCHNIAANTPSIPSINHHSINWNQQKNMSYKSKNQISKAIEYKNPSGKMKVKWIPKKKESNQDNNSIPMSNQNVEPQTKRSPTYNKCPPPSKWSSRKTHKSHGSKNQNSKLHHPLPQVWKIKTTTPKCPNSPSMSTIIHHNPKSHPHSKNPTSQIHRILAATLYHKDTHGTLSRCAYVDKVKPSLKESHNDID
jgi:hypothetical protein